MNKRLTLDEHLKIISAMWKHPDKYKIRIVVTDHGHGHYSVGPDRTSSDVLKEVLEDEAKEK
jgi:hypothetical protein